MSVLDRTKVSPLHISACVAMNHAACHIESRQRHVVGISDQGSRQIALDSLSLLHVVASMFTTSVAHGMVHVLYSVWSRRASSSGGTATPAHQCHRADVTIHAMLPSRKINVTIVWTFVEDIILIGSWNLCSTSVRVRVCLCVYCCTRAPS